VAKRNFAAMKSTFLPALMVLTLTTATGYAQQRSATTNGSAGSSATSSDPEDDPCIDIPDQRFCWTLDPITGVERPALPDTSFINLNSREVMEAKSLCLNYTGNLWSPHQSEAYFSRPEGSDFIFADAYGLFACPAGQQRYFNTHIPFTNASYTTSGSGLRANDHFTLDFAGNMSARAGIGTSLDYVYARGDYQSQGTKPLKWLSYLYYTGEKYKAYLSANVSYYGNQENGGITDRDYVLRPEIYNSNFTEASNIATNLIDTWNATDHHNLHFTHSYDMGFYRTEQVDDSTEMDVFVPVSTIFHTIDVNNYERRFRMDAGAQDNDTPFFANDYINSAITADTTAYRSFTTYAGLRLNEGFNKWSQFGVSAFIGYEYQQYTNLVDTLDLSYIDRKHTSHNVWVGGQLSRHLSSALTFDVTGRTCLSGDKVGDVRLDGSLGTTIPLGKSDSLVITAEGLFSNSRVSYLMDHYFSNHFRWSNDFDREQRLRLQGAVSYPRSGTRVSAGIEHINNFHYFNAEGLPQQYSRQLDIFSIEAEQRLKLGILHWDNAVLFQSTTEESVLALPQLSVRSDLYLSFIIAHTLRTQLGVSGYYFTRYYAPNYQPATQQFCAQQDIKCGNYPVANAYVNCRLKKIRFFVMMYNMLDGAFTSDTFIEPYYPLMPRRFEWGVSIDFSN
jgi:hypothetical protein